MNKNIDQILQDLYLLDPELKEYKLELKKIIIKLLESKPDIKLDQKFALDLKKELKIKIKNMPKTKNNLFKNLSYVLAGAAICAILIFSIDYYQNQGSSNIQLAFKPQINKLEKNRAFGSLSLEGWSGSNTEVSTLEAKGLGGGGGTPSGEKMLVPAPHRVNYNFIYQGEDLVLDQSQMEVLKRNKENNSTLPAILKNMNLGLVDLNGVQNGKLQNINIVEDQEYGYMISVNFQEGQIAIYQNWNQWPQERENNLSLDDIPPDDKLINIAEKFIQAKGINLDNYGDPYVNDSWKEYAHRTVNPEGTAEGEIYVPNSIPVIYPLVLDGKEVFDQGGNPSGISLNVDIRYKKVAGAWNIKTQDYQSSFYQTETNTKRILDIAQAGGINYHQYYQADESVDLELESPELIYITYYKYINNQNEEMIIPALRFKVKDNEEIPYKLDNILVPLVKEMLEDLESREDEPVFKTIDFQRTGLNT